MNGRDEEMIARSVHIASDGFPIAFLSITSTSYDGLVREVSIADRSALEIPISSATLSCVNPAPFRQFAIEADSNSASLVTKSDFDRSWWERDFATGIEGEVSPD